ncbi:MAG: SUMF1/EgtB/PvdO family nonheme iron enzyme [Candidatus Symbiothrix sp.]|jgi:hypothetical protein|nr:SUMF1/EgtB/PvdO family nonheme iron enzyme [Candidatus Symbiothrix sp.]
MSNNTEKINRIILIGNGFDLAHGLKTSYGHFIDWFWEEQLSLVNSKIETYKKNISSKIGDNELYLEYENNYFFVRIKDEQKNKTGATEIDGGDREIAIFSKDDLKKSVEYKNKFLEAIEKKLSSPYWSGIEQLYHDKLCECLNEFHREKEKDITSSVNKLNADFQAIKEKLEIYLETQTMDDTIQGIKDIIFREEDTIDQILLLNFNYTSTEKLYEKKGKTQRNHIHGELKEADKPIIFGYGDEISEEFKKIISSHNKDFMKNIKSVRYGVAGEYQELLRFIETPKTKYEIFILGHSCERADRTLLNHLFEHPNCKKIKYFYFKGNTNDFENTAINIYNIFTDTKYPLFRARFCKFEEDDFIPQKDTKLQEIISGDIVFALVEGGEFNRDSNDFYIGKYSVTQKQYAEVMGDNPSYFKGENLPVESVSWYDAVLFCNRLSEKNKLPKYYIINGNNVTINKSAKGFRLPTEAEWEYAASHCRKDGTETHEYAGCNNEKDLKDYAWYDENSDVQTHEVGSAKEADKLKIHDMSGNVWEWCYDLYDDTSIHVLHGGSWGNDARICRVSHRGFFTPTVRSSSSGFRLVLPL